MRTHSGSLSSLSLFHVTQKHAKIKEKPSNRDGLRATPIIFGVIFEEVFVEVEERNFRVLTENFDFLYFNWDPQKKLILRAR